ADYLHRAAERMKQFYGNTEAAQDQVRRELQENHYDPTTGTLVWTEGQVDAFQTIHRHLTETLYNRAASGAGGIGPHLLADDARARQITAFIAWTAWTATARRPGKLFSYTNNWPPDD